MRKILIAAFAILLLSTTAATAETIDLTITFSRNDLSFSVRDGYDQVTMRGLDLSREAGRPQLPAMIARAVVPPGETVRGMEILDMEVTDLPGRYDIYPAQRPQILSIAHDAPEKIVFTKPDELVYRSQEPYPDRPAVLTGDGFLAGYHLADLEIRPLIYLPAEKKLRLIESLDLRLVTEPGGRRARPVGRRSGNDREFYQDLLGEMVLNPTDAARMAPRAMGRSSKTLPAGDYQYVIITMNSYVDEFQPLADWKGRKGVPDTIVTREWIESNYSGYDVCEQIRNFIIDAYTAWDTRWVLLGGDTNVIPSRTAYAMTCEANYHVKEDSIRADLYFSDLDGDWDADGDHIYGEVADSVDLYADVFVGRASVSSQSEATAWVNKMLLYEKSPQPDQALKMLFLAEELWGFPNYTDGGVHKNMIDEQSVPPRFDPIKKLYESLGNESADSAQYYINQGQNLINHDGHCWYDVMSMGEGTFNRTTMDNLTNADYPAILYSIGCWPAAYDFNCMAEHWTNNPNGGGVAFIGNSRYGWGSPGNPGYGYSDLYDTRFFHELFVEGEAHIGAALAASKTYYVPKSRQENVYRIHQYEVNLLGDPEMPIWTDTPGSLMVAYDDQVPQGSVNLEVTVTDGAAPLEDARVCITCDDGLYWYGLTGSNGQVAPALTIPSTDSVHVTVTAQNFLPHLGASGVTTSGPYVAREGLMADDSPGDGNGEINPGDTIDLSLSLKNFGAQVANGVTATLRAADGLTTVLDSLGSFGNIAPGDTAISEYQIEVSESCTDGQILSLNLEIEDGAANVWHSRLRLESMEPIVVCSAWAIDEGGNGVPEPGDTVEVDVTLNNQGLGLAAGVTAWLSSLDQYATVLIDSAAYGDIAADSAAVSGSSYRLVVTAGCPAHHDLALRMDMSTSDGHDFIAGLRLAVGERGMTDDMENGQGAWTHGGTLDHWHLSTQRSHSGSTSWYCADGDSLEYEKKMNAFLLSPELVLGYDSKLTFWSWFDVPIYGSDGLYVVVGRGAQWDTLDYFGSGGALDQVYMGNDWLPDEYDLSAYDTAQVKFIFKSDYDYEVGEGFYIDDVTVSGAWMTSGDVLPPAAVADLRVAVLDTALTLSWSPGGAGAAYYVIYRDTAFDFQAATANSLATTADTSYVDESPGLIKDPGRNYYYCIRAVADGGLKSAPSTSVGEFDRQVVNEH